MGQIRRRFTVVTSKSLVIAFTATLSVSPRSSINVSILVACVCVCVCVCDCLSSINFTTMIAIMMTERCRNSWVQRRRRRWRGGAGGGARRGRGLRVTTVGRGRGGRPPFSGRQSAVRLAWASAPPLMSTTPGSLHLRRVRLGEGSCSRAE